MLAHTRLGPEPACQGREAPSLTVCPEACGRLTVSVFCREMRQGGGCRPADMCARACPPGDRPKATRPGSAPQAGDAHVDVVGHQHPVTSGSAGWGPRRLLEPGGGLSRCDSSRLAWLPRSACVPGLRAGRRLGSSAVDGNSPCPSVTLRGWAAAACLGGVRGRDRVRGPCSRRWESLGPPMTWDGHALAVDSLPSSLAWLSWVRGVLRAGPRPCSLGKETRLGLHSLSCRFPRFLPGLDGPLGTF